MREMLSDFLLVMARRDKTKLEVATQLESGIFAEVNKVTETLRTSVNTAVLDKVRLRPLVVQQGTKRGKGGCKPGV